MTTNVQAQSFTAFKDGLRDQLGQDVYNSYFEALALGDWQDDAVTLVAKNDFSANLITERFKKPVRDVWFETCGPVSFLKVAGANEPISAFVTAPANVPMTSRRPMGVPGGVAGGASPAVHQDPAPLRASPMPKTVLREVPTAPVSVAPTPTPAPAVAIEVDEDAPESAGGVLNGSMTLDRYCVNDTNQLARQAVTRLLEGTSSPVTYLYGTSGRGKSHLLNAAGLEWVRRRPGSKLLYIPYDSLMSDVVEAHISSSVKQLRRFLHDTDILVFDDVHMLRGRKRTQEELACLIERLQHAGKPVLAAGALSPTELAETGISQRLADRLSGGVKVAIDSPDLELRMRVARQMAAVFTQRTGHIIPERHVELIARRCDTSVRDVEGAVRTFELEVECRPTQPLSDERALKLLDGHLSKRRETIGLEELFEFTAETFGITPDEMRGKARKQHIVRARQAFSLVARKITDSPLTAIGGMIQRDHTTVMHSVTKAEIIAESDASFGDRLSKILAEFGVS